jgi:hypothetical protein
MCPRKEGGELMKKTMLQEAPKSASTILTRLKKGLSRPSKTETAIKADISIDYPQENDKINLGHYAVRITSQGEGKVEISVNGKDWQHCRLSIGYYWFDWWPTESGTHELVARSQPQKGKPKRSSVRSCRVVGPSLS